MNSPLNEVRMPVELNAESSAALRSRMLEATSTPAPLILRGSDEAFCKGVSLTAIISGTEPTSPVRAVSDALYALLTSPVPTLAVVRGFAAGGGVGLASACDTVIATPDTRLSLPELLYGLLPVLIVPALRTRIDVRHFHQLVTEGASIDAAKAKALGLVDHIVEPTEVDAWMHSWVRRHQRANREALGQLRVFMHGRGLRQELDEAVELTTARLRHPNVLQSLNSFLQEGIPPWS